MKPQALQRTQEPLKARSKAPIRRSSPKGGRTVEGSGPHSRNEGTPEDRRKHLDAQKVSYKEAFKELAAQADAEHLEWMEWDADSGGLA